MSNAALAAKLLKLLDEYSLDIGIGADTALRGFAENLESRPSVLEALENIRKEYLALAKKYHVNTHLNFAEEVLELIEDRMANAQRTEGSE